MSSIDYLEILSENNLISPDEAGELSITSQGSSLRVLKYIFDNNILSREGLGQIIEKKLQITYINLFEVEISDQAIGKIAEEVAKKYKIMPVYQLGSVLSIVSSDPKNIFLLDHIEKTIKQKINILFSFPDEIDNALIKYYSPQNISTINKMPEIKEQPSPSPTDNLPSLLSKKEQQYLINESKNIYKQAEQGKMPSFETSSVLSNKIVEHVETKLSLTQCINQLRVTDEYTYSHSVNVAMLSSIFAKELGYGKIMVKEIALGALLHDIGKVRIPPEILKKPAKLTEYEMEIMKLHPVKSWDMLKEVGLNYTICDIVRHHHERIDGKGYPDRLSGEQLSKNAMIVGIVDIYDALISERPYKKPLSYHEALNILMLEETHHFDFQLLYTFLTLIYKKNSGLVKAI